MRLAVDARWMIGRYRGMGLFSRALISPVTQSVTALLPRGQSVDEWPCVAQGFGLFPWWEQMVLPGLVREVSATHLLCPYNTAPVSRMKGVCKVVVVHDLIFMEPLSSLPASRSLYQNAGRLYRRYVVPHAVRSADVLVTVSNYTRMQMCDRFGIAPERVFIVPNSVDDSWFVSEPASENERGRYLLSVTGEAPSKNVAALLDAFSQCRRQYSGDDVVLRIVGVRPEFHAGLMAHAASLGVAEFVKFELYVDADALLNLYRHAMGFVLPSLYEGFGIPVIEAMASGAPVACSNTSSLPEVAGDAALLFDPRSVESMAGALSQMIQSIELRRRLIDAGQVRAQQFSSETVGKTIHEFWQRVS